jgi:hypothetical protein
MPLRSTTNREMSTQAGLLVLWLMEQQIRAQVKSFEVAFFFKLEFSSNLEIFS